MSAVDGAAHTQKDDVESNGGSLEKFAKVFVLFLCGIQLVLRSGVLTVLDLDEVNVTPRYIAEVFIWVGAVWGWWLCWWLAVLLELLGCSQSPSVAPCHSEEPTPLQ